LGFTVALKNKIVPAIVVGSLVVEAAFSGRREERENPDVDPPEFLSPSPVGNAAVMISVTSSAASSVSGGSWYSIK